MNKNRKRLTKHINDILYLLKIHYNLILSSVLSGKNIDFKSIRNKIIIHYLEKTIAIKL